MSIIASRLSSDGVYQVNELDEVTPISGANTRVTPSTVYASQFDEIALVSGSVYFNGSSYLTATGYTGTVAQLSGDFTVEVWVNPINIAGAIGYVFCVGDDRGGYGIAISPSRIPVFVYYVGGTYSSTLSSSSAISYNQWYHIAAVRSGTTLTLYVDGVSVASTTMTATQNGASNLSGQPYIKLGRMSSYGYYYTGYVSNLRIVKGTALYTGNFTPSSSPLKPVSNTTFLLSTTQGYPTSDFSPNNFTITNNGATYSSNTPFSSANTGGPIALRQSNTGIIQTSSYMDEFLNKDEYWNNVTLLTNFETGLIDVSSVAATTSIITGSPQQSTSQVKYGTYSGYWPYGSRLRYAANSRRSCPGDFTFEFWMFCSSIGSTYSTPMIVFRSTINGDFSVYNGTPSPQSGKLSMGLTGATGVSGGLTPNSTADSTWHHYACVRSGNTITNYQDGISFAVSTYSGAADFGSTVPFQIGAWTNGANDNSFVGFFDDIRLTNGVARYLSNFTPPEKTFSTT